MTSSDLLPKLLPCPFCGGQAKQRTSFGAFFIECGGCTAEVSGGGYGEWEEIKLRNIENWNRRTPSGAK
jgi:ribosomal protein L37AE/L43A